LCWFSAILASFVACHAPERTAETHADAAPVPAKVVAAAPLPAAPIVHAPPRPLDRDRDASAGDAPVDGGASRRVPVAPGLPDALCGGRKPCSVRIVRKAGLDRKNRPMLVATVDRGMGMRDPTEPVPEGGVDDSLQSEFSSTDDEDDTTPGVFDAPCHHYEHWLAVRDGGGWSSQLLLASCNDGYGVAGVGSDDFRVRDGSVEIGHSGGSNWRWDESWVVSLDPLRVRSDEWGGAYAFGGRWEHGSWNWELFRGRVQWLAPHCTASGDPPSDDTIDVDAGDITYTYDPIPQVTIDPSFTGDGWKTTALGGCSEYVDSSGEHGFVAFGGPGAADDATMHVVASADGTLFVEVRDDRWVGPSSHWVADDHVELWTSTEEPSYMDSCLPHPDTTPPVQWAVRIADGRVFSGQGHPDPAALPVDRASAPGVARLRIGLPDKTKAVTVVYSDGDDGAHQKRLIATSALRFGVTGTLGRLYVVKPAEASCAVRDGRLEPRLVTPRRARDHAVIGEDEP
jgi:hypothetical protein